MRCREFEKSLLTQRGATLEQAGSGIVATGSPVFILKKRFRQKYASYASVKYTTKAIAVFNAGEVQAVPNTESFADSEQGGQDSSSPRRATGSHSVRTG